MSQPSPRILTILENVETTTIIVGGGICGLSTAYHLAELRKTNPLKHRVIVIDALAEVFGAVSGLNSGVVAYRWFSGDLREFARHSYQVYKRLAETCPTFREFCGYREHSMLRLVPGSGPSATQVPKWLRVPKDWHVENNPGDGHAAALNQIRLGQWLAAQCQAHGVEIYTLARLIKVDLSDHGTLHRVYVRQSNVTYKIDCQNLILAAGAWTPLLFHAMFPESSCSLYPKTNSANWTILENLVEAGSDSLGQVVLKDESGDRLEIVGQDDGKIFMYGLNDTETPIGDVEVPNSTQDSSISKMENYARRFLVSTPRVLATGRIYRPTIARELPIIARVPSNKLRPVIDPGSSSETTQKQKSNEGVYLCYGHGSYGLTHGMGSGVLISQMVLGLSTDLDVSKFDLPE
ncbi:hypothetical protein MMC17_005523 [Xylographa soralifera]|nr:hypothetical protein [Xylographa soralifera]